MAYGIVGLLLLSGGFALGSTAAAPGPAAGAAPTPSVAPSGPGPAGGTPPSATTALPAGLVPRVEYSGPTPAHAPPAWGSSGIPPGAPIPNLPAGASSSTFLSQWSNGGLYHDGTCVGKWPSGGQSLYADACVGHDEPALNPYSNLPGSGGNVSWNVSLPLDRTPTQNQSDVYIAVWFGMNLADPYGYDGQCFLELQMYPDTNGTGAPQAGVWSAFAVAWQIQLSTGFENSCFAGQMNEAPGVPLQMNEGDHLYVNMTGWQGSPLGERISVVDSTLGVRSSLRLYNHHLGYPLDPAYSANNVDDALPWSPGGDLPVSFAFESGHTYDDPQNDTFGGCNSGLPPPTPLNGAVPCGSYSPRAWASDTQQPWHFYPVSFSNGAQKVFAAQYGFEQDFGASAWIDGLSNGACTGRDGSAYCSYPWYSYAASIHAFEFGATPYTRTTQDFGTYAEYDSVLQTDSGGLNYYPVRNFTVPQFPGDNLKIRVQGPGTVFFLDDTLAATAALDHLPSGSYSVNAVPAPGAYFEGFSTSGGVSLDAPATAWNSLELSGNAVLTATFGPTPPASVAVRVADAGGRGFVTMVPGFAFSLAAVLPPAGPGFGLAPVPINLSAVNVPGGHARSLLPGIYSILANPRPGYNFTGWSGSGGVYVFTPAANYTWANITGPGTLTAHYALSPLRATVWLATYPSQGGQIEFGHSLFASGAVLSRAAGSYPLRAVPAPGYTFVTWAPGFMSTISDWSASSNVLVQYGDDYLTAVFHSDPVLTRGGSGVGGTFALNGRSVGAGVTLSQTGNITYQLEAAPSRGYAFAGWNVAASSAAWIADPTAALTTIQVNASTVVTPLFVTAASFSVDVRAHGGSTDLNAAGWVRGHDHVGLASGSYYLAERPGPGFMFGRWTTSGGVSVSTYYTFNTSTMADVENLAGTWQPWYVLTVTGPGNLTAHFRPLAYRVTFIDWPFSGQLSITLNGTAGTYLLRAGHSASLPPGVYWMTLQGTAVTNVRWFGNSNLTFSPGIGPGTYVRILGSGTIYVVGTTQNIRPGPGGGQTDPAGPGPVAAAVRPRGY